MSKIKQRLDKTIGKAKTIDDVNRIKAKLLAQIEATTSAAPTKTEPMRSLSRPQRKDMAITGDTSEVPLTIELVKKPESAPTVSFVPQSVRTAQAAAQGVLPTAEIAALEKKDPINEVAVSAQPVVQHAPLQSPQKAPSLWTQYLNSSQYQEFITTYYTSVEMFGKMLDATIAQIESETVDVFERWLHEEKASPFAYMQDMSIGDIQTLAANPNVRRLLAEQNIKYETFLAWIDLLPEMLGVVGADVHVPLRELYARWMVESAMRYVTQAEVG